MRSLTQFLEPYWRTYPRTDLVIALSCLALVGVTGSVTMRRVQFEHDTAIANEMKKNSNLAMALEEHAIRTLKALIRHSCSLTSVPRKGRA
jgi:hypothetical protein